VSSSIEEDSGLPLIRIVNKATSSADPVINPAQPNSPSHNNQKKATDPQDDLRTSLRSLLGQDMRISGQDQLDSFTEIMFYCYHNKLSPNLLLEILSKCPNKEFWKAFVKNKKAMTVLYNWRVGFGGDGEDPKLMLRALNMLPFDVKAFEHFNFVRYVKSVKKNGSPGNF
jgi:hypothetical protein